MNKQEKCSATQIGRIVVHRGESEEKRIYKEELKSYLEDGWLMGATESHRRNNGMSHRGHMSANKGKSPTKETREKISNSLMGHIPWNKDRSMFDEMSREKQQEMIDYYLYKENSVKKTAEHFGINYTSLFYFFKSIGIVWSRKDASDRRTKETIRIKVSKDYLTKKKNGTFNTSSKEERAYKELLEQNRHKTIYRNYKCERYPFYCDFYIVEDDLFIELNTHWTHGGRPYDADDEECRKQLSEWQEKAKTSQFYANAIETWTVRDVKKAKVAKDNKLNYKVIY